MVTLVIDGQEVQVEEGTTVLEAAQKADIEIPTLCYHKALTPYGACRLCVVEITSGGRTVTQASCLRKAEEGMEVRTNSERIMRGRKLMIELLLARCPKSKEIQELAEELGVKETRLKKKNEDCMLCGLCVRVCHERMGVGAISFVNRGSRREVKPPFETYSEVCQTCGACITVCPNDAIKIEEVTRNKPIPIPSEFNVGLEPRHPIYMAFPQAIPKVPVIDTDSCAHFIEEECKACEEFCEPKAINYGMKEERLDLNVGAIILATGLDLYDVSGITEYGYGRIKNVITAMEYERLTAASGPTMGELKRPSDDRIPENIAFIQCVGSRDLRNKAYCSSVCCMHATKEAMLAFEHHPGTKSTIFYMDMRAVGKRFQEYIARAKKEYNVTYIRGRPGRIEVNSENDNPVIWYEETTAGEIKSFEAELVVLAQAMTPRITEELAEILGIELDENGFVKIPDKLLQPLDTTKSGIFACGYVHSPRDIPDSVTQASGAAGRTAEAIAGDK
jgi:heterodisulfide reductase subunit A